MNPMFDPIPIRLPLRMLVAAILIGTALKFPISSAAADLIVGPASAINGDTLEINGQDVRLFGIVAPDARQICEDAGGQPFPCGQKAARVLEARMAGGVVTCEPKDVDRDGYTVAVCRVFGEDLSAWMVGLGWAVAFRTYSTRYVPAEELAQKRRSGLWAGRFSPPNSPEERTR